MYVAADKPQLCNTELSELVAAVQRAYVQRIVDNGMQQLALVRDSQAGRRVSFLFLGRLAIVIVHGVMP